MVYAIYLMNYQLKCAKTESLKLIPKMYYDNKVICLSRKREKIKKALRINKEHNVEELRRVLNT